METKKKVDEAWKARVETEKKKGEALASGGPLPEPDFSHFVSGLGMQALFLLGELSDPKEKDKIKPDYKQAKYTIDLLGMLKKKTAGNLTREEANLIENLLYDLRMKYLKHV